LAWRAPLRWHRRVGSAPPSIPLRAAPAHAPGERQRRTAGQQGLRALGADTGLRLIAALWLRADVPWTLGVAFGAAVTSPVIALLGSRGALLALGVVGPAAVATA
jgi:hypothetical protein